MANYGYEHVAEEAQRYLAVHDEFRQLGSTPEHKPERQDPTQLGLPSVSWTGKVNEAPSWG